jgi:hypothetical protein
VTETRPDPVSGYTAWRALSDAIAHHTDLKPFGAGGPFEGKNAGQPLHHRTFQVEPGTKTYRGRMRASDADTDPDDTDIVQQDRLYLIRLRHEYSPELHDTCYQQADADAEAVEDALMVRPEAAWVQPVLVNLTSVREGGTIVQTLTMKITYERPLPPMRE